MDDNLEHRIANGSNIDELTGLRNKAGLYELLAQHLGTASPLTVLLFDLDEFRVINDSLGHEFGDQILRSAARRLSAVFDDRVFRSSGDEFVVVLPTQDPEQLGRLIDIVLARWRTPLIIDGSEIYSGISIGTVTRTPEHRAPQDLFQHAEIAMYEAKRLGRGRAVNFEPELRANADAELETQMLGRRAAINREFHLQWQPMFDLRTGAVSACEALLRWRPAGGLVTHPAAEFLPFLERSGLIIPVGEQVIQQAFQQGALWRGNHDIAVDTPISMNVSHRQLESGNVVESLVTALDDGGVDGSELIVEIPESVIGRATAAMTKDVQRLRAQGVRIAIEDFGGGHASLLALDGFPIDIVKLHKSAASQIEQDENNRALTAIIDSVKAHELTLVFTGCESQNQLNWFRERGCDWVQGYFVAKPAEPDLVTNQLASRASAA